MVLPALRKSVGEGMKTKTCKLCGKEFDKKAKGRIKMTLKVEKGEKIVWICPNCAKRIRVG